MPRCQLARSLALSLVVAFGALALAHTSAAKGPAPAGLEALLAASLEADSKKLKKPPKASRKASKKSKKLAFEAPADGLLALAGDLGFALRVPARTDPADVVVALDGGLVDPSSLFVAGDLVSGVLSGLGEGRHGLAAGVLDKKGKLKETVATWFELAALDRPDVCEFLNDADCLLPFPSSRFLVPGGGPNGLRVAFPEAGMPSIVAGNLSNLLNGVRSPLDPTPYNRNDGFSPTVQILMHFPGGVDLEASGASRLLEATRNFDLSSLRRNSPTVLLDAESRRRVAHFAENDARAMGSPRQITFLRPGQSLLPGHRYIVAVRRLVAPDGSPVEPEPAFAALRDGRPTTIPAIEARREHFEELFETLRRAGVKRRDLVLAFDFVVQSDEGLTHQMLAMRDTAFAELETSAPFAVFEEEVITPPDACEPGRVWKLVEGVFRLPLFLTTDPDAVPPPRADPIAAATTLGFLATDAADNPVRTGNYLAPYGISIPCEALEGPRAAATFGHGLFGNGAGTVRSLALGAGDLTAMLREQGLVDPDVKLDLVIGGTNWSGLSSLDVPSSLSDPTALLASFIGQLFIDFDDFGALPDRLRQGQLATLVLARMLHQGVFNSHPAFQTPDGQPVLAAGEESFYFGASLGGIMGLMFAALSPDVERASVDVPAINFSFLLQRAKPFKPFQDFLTLVDPDPLIQALSIGLIHELWVRGESAGYANHVTGKPLAPLQGPLFATNAKRVLMTVARFDQQVSTLGAQIAAATLGLPNLRGSIERRLPLVPDRRGPLPSAHVMYDTGSYVLGEDDQFIPPLANLANAVNDNECDPHGVRAFIPASLQQLVRFLRPGGLVENFCDGLCDVEGPREIPFGADAPCDPND